jgi:DeoR family transcriptional regulator, catabolite repression regulator
VALNDRQLKILKVIDDGNITGDDIVNATGSSMQMLSYYLNTMADDGYLKAARVYDNATREFLVVRAYLTDEGKAALVKAGISKAGISVAGISVAVEPESTSDSSAEASIAVKAGPLDYAHLGQSIAQIQSQVQFLPDARRELVEVYIEDLQTEVNIAYRRKLVRIKAYFFAILNAVSPLLKQSSDLNALRQPLESIAAQLQIPIRLPD